MSASQLTILLDHDDLVCLERLCPDALSGTVLAFDVELHAELLDRGVDHMTPWDIVQPSERSYVQAFYAQVWDYWQTSARAELDGLDCFELAAYRHVCCLKRLAWAAYALQRCFDEVRPAELVTFEETSGHGLDQPAGYRKMPLLFGLARGIAEQANIPVRLLRRRDVAGQTGFVDQVAAGDMNMQERIDANDVLAGRPFVLFAGSGYDLLRQLPVIQALDQQGTLVPIQLYKSADASVRRRLKRHGHVLWHESQVTDQIDLTTFEPWIRAARRRFDEQRRRTPAELRCIFANPHMDTHFDFLFGQYLRRMVWQVCAWRGLFARHRPEVLVANYAAPIVDVAADLGIPTLVLPHGLMVIGDDAFPLALPKRATIGAVSELHAQRLKRWGIVPNRIRVTGDPGFDRRAPHIGQLAIPPPQQDRRRQILLISGSLGLPSASSYLPETDWADAARCFEMIGRLAERRHDWEFTIKCHPRYDHPGLYEHVNRGLPPERRLPVVSDRGLDDLVPKCDAAVCVNVKSSAIFETSVWHKPVFLLHQSMIWLDRQAWGIDRWPQIAGVEELESELDAVFADPSLYRTRVEQTCRAFESCFDREPTAAGRRCVEVIDDLAAIPATVP